MHAVTSPLLATVSAESVGGSTSGARVTWSTTVPPECMTSVRVEFRTSRFGPVVAAYTTTNTSHSDWSTVCYILLHQGGSYWKYIPHRMPTTQMLSSRSCR